MAQSVKSITNLKSNIQSRAQEAVTDMQQKTASSTAATQAGSTTTPTVTETPKVTPTAKAVPSVSKPDITPTVPTVNARDLLGTKTTPTLRQASQDLLSPATEKKDITKSVIPLNIVRAADAQGGTVKSTVDKTLTEQFSYWLNKKPKEITERVGDFFQKPAEKLGLGFVSIINDTEYYTAKLADVIETSLGGEGGFVEAFQEQQGKYWDTYTQEYELQSSKLYDEDQKAQELSSNVSNWLYDITGNQEVSDMLGSVAGRVYSNVKDPEQVAYTVGYMLPALIMGWATGGGFWANTAIWTPSQSTLVYKDFAQDQELSEKFTDNQLFGISTGFGTILSMVESFGDALGDMPWAKNMSNSIRGFLARSIRKETSKTLSKEMMDAVDKNVIKEIKKPVLNAIKKRFLGGMGEGVEEVTQETIQTEGAIALGSKRDHMTLEQALTIGGTAMGIGWLTQTPGAAINIKQNSDLRKQYEDFSRALDRVAPGINEKTKMAFFSAMITSQQNDANVSEKNIERYEAQTTQLYNQISELEQQLEATTDENTKTSLKDRISNLNNQVKEIDSKINQRRNTEAEINQYLEEYNGQQEELPAQAEQQLPGEEGGENLSERAMGSVDQGEVSQGTWNPSESKQSFDRSMQQIANGTQYWNTEFAKDYAYATSGIYRLGDTEQNQKMINKVQSLLSGIGIKIRFGDSLEGGTRGLYDGGVVYYKKGNKELTLYGHEVFHAMMDVINNGKLDDAQLQTELQNILNQAIEEVKKQFGIDVYKSGKELEYANKFAEEWLANSFGEYLAGREVPGPRTFVQKIIDFFNQILDLFRGNKKTTLNKELKKAFDKIAEGEVTGRRGIPTMVSMPMASPIEESTDITQEAMANVNEEEFENLVKENQQQVSQQEELGEHYEDIVEIGEVAEQDNETEVDFNEAPELSSDVSGVQTTPQTIKNAFGKDKKKKKKAFSLMKTEAGQAFRDLFTPAMSRIYNISPRVAGRLMQMEGKEQIYTTRYRLRAKPFVEAISKLDDNAKLEVKKALLDYGVLASEQGADIEQYKKDEVAKLKEVLSKYGISEQATNDMFAMLAELGQRYKDAGLSITISDIYFPRTVIDYEGLSEYISERTGTEGKEKENLLNRIAKIRRDEKLTEEEKEKAIRRLLTVDYHEPGTTSKHGKERKMGKLSDWGEGIYKFYGDPLEALDSYIVTMERAVQRQTFLGGLQEEAGLKGENLSFTEIVEGLVDQGMISNEDLEELKKTVLAVLDKKPSPKVVKRMKDITYIATLTNFLSAINQLDDLGMTIIKNKSGLKQVVKAIFGKAGIKYTELGLDDAYEMFREQGKITNWLFKKSFFDTFDRLGKTSFINAAWDSLVSQAKNPKSREVLKKRLEEMYGTKTMEHMMEKIDSNDYMTNGQIDIDILVDLLYQLGSTQPIYTSAMPTVYLNNPWVRLCYSLQSFLIKRIDFLVQGTKQVYRNNGGGAKGVTVAGAWLMGVSAFLAAFGVAIGDIQDWMKGESEETVLWKLLNEGIEEALKEVRNEGSASWLKIWNLSLYDKKTYNRDGMWGVIMSKVKPPIIGIGKNFVDAVTEHNADEITDLVQYVPLIGKLIYYQFLDEIGKETGKSDSGFVRRKDEGFVRREDEGFTRRKDEGFVRRK